jgi:hypothetical protein
MSIPRQSSPSKCCLMMRSMSWVADKPCLRARASRRSASTRAKRIKRGRPRTWRNPVHHSPVPMTLPDFLKRKKHLSCGAIAKASVVLKHPPDLGDELLPGGHVARRRLARRLRRSKKQSKSGDSSARVISSTKHSSAEIPSTWASALSVSASFFGSIRSQSFVPATGIRKSAFGGTPIASGGIGFIRLRIVWPRNDHN